MTTDTHIEEETKQWKVFDDNQALLSHIFSCKLSEELVQVPEWNVEILCRALAAEQRMRIQIRAYDEKTKRVDYRGVFHLVVVHGCFNPVNGNKVFTEAQAETLMKQADGAAIERLAFVILRLSSILSTDQSAIRKN